jgi:hypothetical protein
MAKTREVMTLSKADVGELRIRKEFKIKRAITVPLAKLNPEEPINVQFTGDGPRMVQIDSKPDKDGTMKAPATCLRAINLDTGELIDLIASTVLISQLEREFGNIAEGIKGKALFIESRGKRAGKNYNDVYIAELET